MAYENRQEHPLNMAGAIQLCIIAYTLPFLALQRKPVRRSPQYYAITLLFYR